MERLKVIRSEFYVPALQFPPKDFEMMTKCIVDGLWCFNPSDPYEVLIFYVKRLVGIPNYNYGDASETSEPEYNKLSYYNRFSLWTTVFVHEYLLQFFYFRWWMNKQTLFHEFLITYFPFLAFYKFGFKNAYVRILRRE